MTRRRLDSGWAWVAELDGEIVATVTLYEHPSGGAECAWYRKPEVFAFGQFAVRPNLQGQGLGGRMIALLATGAAARGARELALDTADGADHLIRWYEKLGLPERRDVENAGSQRSGLIGGPSISITRITPESAPFNPRG